MTPPSDNLKTELHWLLEPTQSGQAHVRITISNDARVKLPNDVRVALESLLQALKATQEDNVQKHRFANFRSCPRNETNLTTETLHCQFKADA